MSDSFTKLIPSIVSLAVYGAALALFAIVLRSIPVGIAYAIWAGAGIVLITLVGWLWFKQTLDLPAMLGFGLIIVGVIVVQGFSQTLHH